MRFIRRPVGLVCLFVLIPITSAAEPTVNAPSAKAPAVEQLVRDLDDRDFKTREAATAALWQAGEKARPALEEVMKNGSLEAATRAETVLERFDWGVTPDTPKATLDLIKRFRTGDYAAQGQVIQELIRGDAAGVPYLRLLLRKEFAPHPMPQYHDTRTEMFADVARHVRSRVPLLLFDGKTDHAERLLELLPLGPYAGGHQDYAAFLAARGQAKAGIAKLETLRTDTPTAAPALVPLYRAAGETAKAKALLEQLQQSDPALRSRYESLLADVGAWGELADLPAHEPNSAEGLKALRLRLAGKRAEADAVLDGLKASDTDSRSRGFTADGGAVGLFLNGRTADGLERLKAAESAPHIAADIHAARLEFTAALDLIRAGLADDHGTMHDGSEEAVAQRQLHTLYKLKKGRLLAQLGERDSASQVFAGLTDWAERAEPGVQAQVIQAAARSGFPTLAAELLGRCQARREDFGGRARGMFDPFETLFEADADAAKFWWRVVRDADQFGDHGRQMQTVHDLLHGKLKPEQLAVWVKAAEERKEKVIVAPQGPTAYIDPLFVRDFRGPALAAAYRAHGQRDKAVAALVAHAEGGGWGDGSTRSRTWVFGVDEAFRPWADLGDLLNEQGKHKEAAAWLERGWRKAPDNPILLHLSGRALVLAGDAAEGQRRMELAHVIPLGNVPLRGRFLEELVNRGYAAAMRTEVARIREIVWTLDGSSVGNVWNQVGRAGAALKEYAVAADAQQRGMHFVLKTSGILYVEGYAYANVPALVHGLTARHLLTQGKLKEAVAEADEALAVVPTHTDTLVGLVHELDKRGHTAEADAAFRRGWDAYAAAVKQHPKSAWLKYSAAWLAAGCRRELDTAKKYAKEAVEAEPTHRGHRECLAEVSFRTGDRTKATEVMSTLAAEDSRNWHLKRQLERYKNAATDSPLPFTDE